MIAREGYDTALLAGFFFLTCKLRTAKIVELKGEPSWSPLAMCQVVR
jgi:hypothetical protein